MLSPSHCRCVDPLVFADDPQHCFRCGKGPCAMPPGGRAIRLRRLPWDLGALQREGRRPDPHLDNVVRLDRLRDGWKVPRPVLQLVPALDEEPREGRLAA
jgi:hypothetical protein